MTRSLQEGREKRKEEKEGEEGEDGQIRGKNSVVLCCPWPTKNSLISCPSINSPEFAPSILLVCAKFIPPVRHNLFEGLTRDNFYPRDSIFLETRIRDGLVTRKRNPWGKVWANFRRFIQLSRYRLRRAGFESAGGCWAIVRRGGKRSRSLLFFSGCFERIFFNGCSFWREEDGMRETERERVV